MGSKLSKLLMCGLVIGFSANLLAHDETESTEDAAHIAHMTHIERQARITELRELLKEDRQAHREDIENRLSNLTEDERAALQERRRMARQAQMRRNGARRGGHQPCNCNEAQTGDSSN